MPAGNKKSNTFRKVFRVTPGHKVATHYTKRKPSKHRCGGCGVILPGMANERPYKMENMPKSAKRPERPFGGVLCSKCSRQVIKEELRDE